MAEYHNQKPFANHRAVTSLKILSAHIVWSFLGPVMLLVILFVIVDDGAGWVTSRDIVYLALVTLIIFARWIDQKSGQGTTSEGKPSTWKDFQRFALTFPVYAMAAWLVAKLLGYFF